MDNYYKSVEKKRKARIDRICKILNKQDYKWTNVFEYTDSTDSVCKVECNHGHVFSIHNKSVFRNVKCPVCFQNLFIGETVCRIVLQALIGCEFKKTRNISELINPKTGRLLEIDGFNEELKIGFEYQGLQHTNFHKFIHENRKQFIDTQYKDKIKVNFFKQQGWSLIIIDQFSKYDTQGVIQRLVSILQKDFSFIKIKKVDEQNINELIKERIADVYRRTTGSEERVIVNNPEYIARIMSFFEKCGATLIEGLFNSKKSSLLVKTKQNEIVKISVAAILNIIDKNIKDNQLTHYNIKEEKLKNVLQKAKKFKTLTLFKKANPELAAWVIRNRYTNKLRAVFGLDPAETKGIQKYTDEYLINEAKKFKTRGQMYHEGRNAYELIILRKLQPIAFAHMVKPSRKKA